MNDPTAKPEAQEPGQARKAARRGDPKPSAEILESPGFADAGLDGAIDAAAAEAAAEAGGGDIAWQREFFAQHRLLNAQVPRRFLNKTFQNFTAKDVVRRRLVEHFQRFVQSFNFEREFPKGLLMIGQVGCGKSHLAVAVLKEVISKGYSGLYYNSPDLLRDIRATYNREDNQTEDDLLEEIANVDLLVLDDLGAENVSGFVLDRFYLIVNARYEGCKPIIVTTNLELDEIRNRLGDRIVSRLIEMCQTIDAFPREDWRRKHLAT